MASRNVALTLAGGGNRAFYQMGLLNRWAERLLPHLRVVAGCSAGACVATVFLSGRADETNVFWQRRRSHVVKNFEWSRVLRGQSPAPHAEVYRDTMVFAMQEGGLERVRSQPFPVLVLAAGLPRALPTLAAVAAGLGAYNLEKKLHPTRVHPTYGRGLGFSPKIFDARDCESPDDMADLVLASSATPPFTPVGRYHGHRLLDGGMVDNVPAFAAEAIEGVERNLVLLTRPYPDGVLGRHDDRLYVGPTEPTPISRWDYTRPDLLDATVEMGERESALYDRALDAFLGNE